MTLALNYIWNFSHTVFSKLVLIYQVASKTNSKQWVTAFLSHTNKIYSQTGQKKNYDWRVIILIILLYCPSWQFWFVTGGQQNKLDLATIHQCLPEYHYVAVKFEKWQFAVFFLLFPIALLFITMSFPSWHCSKDMLLVQAWFIVGGIHPNEKLPWTHLLH